MLRLVQVSTAFSLRLGQLRALQVNTLAVTEVDHGR